LNVGDVKNHNIIILVAEYFVKLLLREASEEKHLDEVDSFVVTITVMHYKILIKHIHTNQQHGFVLMNGCLDEPVAFMRQGIGKDVFVDLNFLGHAFIYARYNLFIMLM
jgi:uncharacterized membrane protein